MGRLNRGISGHVPSRDRALIPFSCFLQLYFANIEYKFTHSHIFTYTR